jgi:hypothetical protein
LFVSDESRISDFLASDADIVLLRERLDMPKLARRDLIREVALALRGNKGRKTVHSAEVNEDERNALRGHPE